MVDKAYQDYFDLVVVSPDNTLYEGKVKRLMAPGIIQELAILPNHTPLYSQLNAGILEIHPQTGPLENIQIEGGIIRVKLNRVSIIVGFDILKN
jgi:F-type H+-transporting ATPase subunit epsilon